MDQALQIHVHEVANAIMSMAHRFKNMVASVGWGTDLNAHIHMNYASPSLTGQDVFDELFFAASRIRYLAENDINISDDTQAFLSLILDRSNELKFDNLPSNPGVLILAALEVANSVARHIPWPAAPIEINWEDLREQKYLVPKDLTRRLRFVASQLDAIEPRSGELGKKIKEIEDAHAAAEQLPVDMAELAAKRDEVRHYAEEGAQSVAAATTATEAAIVVRDEAMQLLAESKKHLSELSAEADLVLKKAERALRGSTSVGLARAFARRRFSLAIATGLWTAGLAVALYFAWRIGSDRVETLKSVLVDSKSASIIWANVFLTVLGLGGPIWFAWLSTKQIGTTFRLSEDYAFKATVSQAYEGYRSEAVQIDEALKNRLFAAALDRIEEAPIRLVDPTHHSSPVQEFISQPAIKKQLDALPSVSADAISFIMTKLTAASTAAGAAAGAAAAAVVSKAVTGKKAEPSGEAAAD